MLNLLFAIVYCKLLRYDNLLVDENNALINQNYYFQETFLLVDLLLPIKENNPSAH